MEKIRTVKIYDSEYETTYTAQIQENGSGWIGWIQEHPKVKCEDRTQEALLETLENTLYETLEADWEAWDKQIEEDIKAGRLDQLRKETLEDLRAGRCKDL
jgi:hypothetical protein